MSELQDHPDIASALATGYPRGHREPPVLHCADCGCELEGDETVYIFDGDELCEDCCKERIKDNFAIWEIAEALGATIQSVYACAEG